MPEPKHPVRLHPSELALCSRDALMLMLLVVSALPWPPLFPEGMFLCVRLNSIDLLYQRCRARQKVFATAEGTIWVQRLALQGF